MVACSVSRTVRLSDVASVARTIVSPAHIGAATNYVGLEHLDGNGGFSSVQVEAGELRSAKFSFDETQVLYGKLRPYLRKVARPSIPGVCSTDILPILPGPELDRDYLFHWLRSPHIVAVATARSEGANLPRLSPTTLMQFPIWLPPLTEQRRVAATLDKIDGVQRKVRESLLLLDEFLRAVFIRMFGDPVRNEKMWPTGPMSEAVRSIETGVSIKGEEGLLGPTDWAVLKISAVTTGRYLPGECKVVVVPPNDPVVPQHGDLLFSRANTRELVAATCLVDRENPRVFLPDKLWRIVPQDELVTREYLRFLLANPGFRSTLTRQATGTSGSMLNVSQDKLLRLIMPLPPVDLQRRFASQVWKAYDTRNGFEQRAAETIRLCDSLAQRAFGGSEADASF